MPQAPAKLPALLGGMAVLRQKVGESPVGQLLKAATMLSAKQIHDRRGLLERRPVRGSSNGG